MRIEARTSLERLGRRRIVATAAGFALMAAGGLCPSALAVTGRHAAQHGRSRMHRRHRPAAHGRGYASGVSCAGGACFAGDPFYLYAGQCTWYAAGRRPDLDGIVHGNAGDWLNEARGHVPEGATPTVGAIAVWLPYTGGAYGAGHVAYVLSVSGTSVTVQDFNWGRPATSYHQHTVPASWISGYIYGGPAGAGPGTGATPKSPPAPQPQPGPQPGLPPQPAPQPPAPNSGGNTTPPQAGPVYIHHVTGTCRDGACGLTLRSGAGYSAFSAVGSLPEGAEADVACQAMGQAVSNGYASSAVWDRLTNGDWVSDFYLDTPNIGTFSPPIPQC
jgi:hypothetical protein